MNVAHASVSGHNLLTVAHTYEHMAETHHLWPTLICGKEQAKLLKNSDLEVEILTDE